VAAASGPARADDAAGASGPPGADGAAPGPDEVERAADRDGPDDEAAWSEEAGEVIVVEGRAPDTAEPASRELAAEEIRSLPGAGNDALRALQSLPGFARVPFGLGGLVVRGQSPRDTGVFLDGVRVPLAFHFGGLTSFYPSTMLDRIEVTPGAIGAPWGRVGGGMIALTAERGRTDRWRVGGEVGLLDTSVHADGPTRYGAVTVGVRRSYLDAILAALLPAEDRVLPRYLDAQLRLDGGDPTAGGAWWGSLLVADDALVGDDVAFRLGFARASAGWRRRTGRDQLELMGWLGVDRIAFEEDDGGGFEPLLQRRNLPAGVRATRSRDLPWGFVAAGLDLEGGRFGPTTFRPDQGFEDPPPTMQSAARWAADLGLWAEAYRRLGPRLGVRPGLRLDRLGLSREWTVEPRLTISQPLGELTLRQSIGLQHQPPIVADLEPPDGNPRLRASRALHAAVAAELALPGELALRGAIFAVESDRLPVTVPRAGEPVDDEQLAGTGLGAVLGELFEAQLGSFSYRDNRGRGRSRGVELQLQRRVGPLTGWVAYTWTRARRRDGVGRPWRPYALDQPHVLTAVATRPIGAWRLGARLRYATGNPTAILGFDGAGWRVLGYQRLPAFAALDLRVDRAWPRRGGTIRAFLDVQNATNRRNLEDVTIRDGQRQEVRGLPILPLVGVEYVPRP
jgi:hypothetical protein